MTNTTNPKLPALPSRTQRLNAFAATAAAIAAQYKYPLEIITAIWAVESKWGERVSGPNNYFGITWPSATAPAGTKLFLRRTREVLTSWQLRRHLNMGLLILHEPFIETKEKRNWDVSRNFCGYPDLATGIHHVCRLLTSGPYLPAYKNYLADGSVLHLADHTGRVYATDENWGRLVYQISQQKNVQAAVTAAQKKIS